MNIKKSDISVSFSRSAENYDSAAILQSIIGNNLLKHLEQLVIYPEKIIDIGSGTGKLTQKIKKQFPDACLLAIDIAYGMLKFSHQMHSVCADADALPIRSQSIDLVFSNFMLQWSPNLSKTLEEINRVIKPDGYFIFSTLGLETMKEWRACWNLVDKYPHVHEFHQKKFIEECLDSVGFSSFLLKKEYHQLKFKSLKESLNHTRKIGAGNLHVRRPRGLMGKNKLRQFNDEYRNLRDMNGDFPVTYEVITAICKR